MGDSVVGGKGNPDSYFTVLSFSDLLSLLLTECSHSQVNPLMQSCLWTHSQYNMKPDALAPELEFFSTEGMRSQNKGSHDDGIQGTHLGRVGRAKDWIATGQW